MKNILLLCESYGGGVKTYIDAFAANHEKLSNTNIKVVVSSKRMTGNHMEINKEYIVEDHLSFGKSVMKMTKALRTIHNVVKENQIQVIHANSTFAGVLIYFYKMLYNSNIRVIYTPHGYYSFKPMGNIKTKFVKYVERKINSICVKVIHVSKSEETEALKSNISTKQQSIVIFNGVEEPIKHKKINNDKFTIINMARVDEQKNPHAFVEFAKRIVEENPNVQFIWAGDGKYLEQMRDKVKLLQLESYIQFIGHINDKDALLCQADLYFSTSYYEGLPFSVIEAMSYGVPLLLSNKVGHQDLIKNNKNGLLYDLHDFRTVSEFINAIYYNEEKKAYLSTNSYKVFKESFSIEMMLKNTEDLYLKA